MSRIPRVRQAGFVYHLINREMVANDTRRWDWCEK